MALSATEVCAYVGGFKVLVDAMIDLSLNGIRFDLISSSILLLLNVPQSRAYFRDFADVNKIFSILTSVAGNAKELERDVMVRV